MLRRRVHRLAVGVHGVVGRDVGDVVAGSAVDHVGARNRVEDVVSVATGERVLADAAPEAVVAGAAIEAVVAWIAEEDVVAVSAGKGVVSEPAPGAIGVSATVDAVVAAIAQRRSLPARPEIVSSPPRPKIRSAPAVPVSVSAAGVPRIGFDGLPGGRAASAAVASAATAARLRKTKTSFLIGFTPFVRGVPLSEKTPDRGSNLRRAGQNHLNEGQLSQTGIRRIPYR